MVWGKINQLKAWCDNGERENSRIWERLEQLSVECLEPRLENLRRQIESLQMDMHVQLRKIQIPVRRAGVCEGRISAAEQILAQQSDAIQVQADDIKEIKTMLRGITRT